MRRLPFFSLALTLLLGTAHASAPTAPDSGSPEAKLKAPTSWEGASPLPLTRPHKDCTAVRLGIWARVTCKTLGFVMDVTVLGGSIEGVELREAKEEKGIHVIFPMREGDRREIYAATAGGSGGYTIEERLAFTLSEVWMPGEKEATIVVAGEPL